MKIIIDRFPKNYDDCSFSIKCEHQHYCLFMLKNDPNYHVEQKIIDIIPDNYKCAAQRTNDNVKCPYLETFANIMDGNTT